ncbi:hypothetical protein Tco_1015668 [Tanacetum coccineum]|uniref:Uncharacterized protein n=1 Tax=Tanacetum coccineum TaxID=301880 RepID=A0ABQ5FMS2_9ASTR
MVNGPLQRDFSLPEKIFNLELKRRTSITDLKNVIFDALRPNRLCAQARSEDGMPFHTQACKEYTRLEFLIRFKPRFYTSTSHLFVDDTAVERRGTKSAKRDFRNLQDSGIMVGSAFAQPILTNLDGVLRHLIPCKVFLVVARDTVFDKLVAPYISNGCGQKKPESKIVLCGVRYSDHDVPRWSTASECALCGMSRASLLRKEPIGAFSALAASWGEKRVRESGEWAVCTRLLVARIRYERFVVDALNPYITINNINGEGGGVLRG